MWYDEMHREWRAVIPYEMKWFDDGLMRCALIQYNRIEWSTLKNINDTCISFLICGHIWYILLGMERAYRYQRIRYDILKCIILLYWIMWDGNILGFYRVDIYIYIYWLELWKILWFILLRRLKYIQLKYSILWKVVYHFSNYLLFVFFFQSFHLVTEISHSRYLEQLIL